MQQKTNLKMIFKIHSKDLRKANWNFNRTLEDALKDYPDSVVSIGDSQILRFIDELNGVKDADSQINSIKRAIKNEKKKPKTRQTKNTINHLYSKLYKLQFKQDYLCVIMDRNSDYDRANKGFTVNGITFRRLLGTNGGIKNSTIVYVNEQLYPELKRRLDNGRNPNKELVPAKLEAYQALICSGSTPIPPPKGIIVVDDCITKFKDTIIMISDEADGEPTMTTIEDYDIEHNDSDGYGLMTPEYSRIVNEYLTGDGEHTISGMNTRYAWTKGMVYTFDFVEFGKTIAGKYEIVDAWGTTRDVREAQVILTVSMLKLWDSYDSWEDYYENCEKNHYQFSTTKITPKELENVRNTNYQFLQSYDFSDSELRELCEPTIEEVNGVLGCDYRKSLAFLGGFGLNEDNVLHLEDDYVKALMIDKRLINDPFVRHNIHSMIRKRIELAKKGSIKINANYAMISGDPFALCQSMFGLEVTGILKSGELYHKYWIDKGADEVACFRAPMTCHNNIRKLKLNKSKEAAYWYQYIETAEILNAWDTTCDAMNGSDKDGDTNMCTDNPIIVDNTKNLKTIICVQRKAEKKIPTEDDIIKANKLAFNDDIGTVTNHVTSMFDVQAKYDKDSKEYKELSYRIMCGQLYQQNTIDRAKGIIAKPMPKYWYEDPRFTKAEEDVDQKERERAEFNANISAYRKPYFMIYVYPKLKKDYKDYVKNANLKTRLMYDCNIDELAECKEDCSEFIDYYNARLPVGKNKCVVNRICDIFENEFDTWSASAGDTFDYTILKSDVGYSWSDYLEITKLYKDYLAQINNFYKRTKNERIDKSEANIEKQGFVETFKMQCYEVCSNRYELTNILLDICYQKEGSKRFAWDICGDVIVENLLAKNNNTITFPMVVENEEDFEYSGVKFKMHSMEINKDVSSEQDYFE